MLSQYDDTCVVTYRFLLDRHLGGSDRSIVAKARAGMHTEKLPATPAASRVADVGVIKPMKLSGRGRKRAMQQHAPLSYGTFEVADIAGVSWRTLYNWLRQGRLPEPARAPNGYRLWSPAAVAEAAERATRRRRRRRGSDA